MVSMTNPTIINSSYYVYLMSITLHFFVLSSTKALPPTISETIKADVSILETGVSDLEKTLRGAVHD
jgi:hypothetical protein